MTAMRMPWLVLIGTSALVACERKPTIAAPIVLQMSAQAGATPQAASIRMPVPIAPSVRVLDGDGRPVTGRRVVFFATKGNGSVQPTSPVVTDANGVAALTSWTLGSIAGVQHLAAVIADATTDALVVFEASAAPGPATRIHVGPERRFLVIGDTFTIPGTLSDADGNVVTTSAPPTFLSSMPSVGSVNSNGLVTALAPGTTVITASRAGFSGEVTLTVSSPPSAFAATSTNVGALANGVAIASTNAAYVTYTDSKPLSRFNLPSQTVAGTVGGTQFALDVTFLPDGSRAYVASQASVIVVDVATNTAIDTIPIPGGTVFRVLASADGQYVYATSNDGQFARITTASGAVTSFATNGQPVNGIALHPGRSVLLASSMNGSLYEIDLSTFTLTRTLNIGGMPQGVAVATDGSRVFIARESAELDIRHGVTLERIATVASGQTAFDVEVTPNGRYLIVSRVGGVAVLDAINYVEYQIFPANEPRRIATNAAGTIIMVATRNGEVIFLK